jgi:hypothetical protein
LIDESALLVRDWFDEQWARESITAAADIFDVIWLAVLHQFPNAIPLLKNPKTCAMCPMTRALLRPTHQTGITLAADRQA